jgi:hypothetical protein
MSRKPSKDQKPVKLTPSQSRAVREAEKCFDRGEGITAEQAHTLARKQTRAWLQASGNQATT